MSVSDAVDGSHPGGIVVCQYGGSPPTTISSIALNIQLSYRLNQTATLPDGRIG
ncbi:MAG: hypothetical protein HN731_10725 [Rhodospirillaceae bacterium]|nr:hypothetical protein [Rhodospirillaceae bacterium]